MLTESNIRIDRENGPALVFDGEHVACAEPRNTNPTRGWTKLDLYLSDSGVIIIAVTKCRQKGDRTYAFTAEDWWEVREALDAGGKDGLKLHWSSLLTELLRKTSEKYPEVEEILVEKL